MNNLREVNDDILKEFIEIRKDSISTFDDIDKEYCHYFDTIMNEVLKAVPEDKQDYIKMNFEVLDKAFNDYLEYWNEKFYRNGFCDGVEIITGCFEE